MNLKSDSMKNYVITARKAGRDTRMTITLPMTIRVAEKRASKIMKEMSELRPKLRIFKDVQVTPVKYAGMPDGFIY